MSETTPITFLCLASAEKGASFMRECKQLGCYVVLLTRDKYANGDWPREAIDQIECSPSLDILDDVIAAVNRVSRQRTIGRVAALDDFDVECGAMVREHLRLPGMSYSTARRFRDKLAMRVSAREHDILVPEFVHAINPAEVHEFTQRVAPPWFVKPRFEAAAVGIKKVEDADALWKHLESLGDRQGFFLVEQGVYGDIYHVDSIVSEREVVFAVPHKYGRPPFDVAHGGGVFSSQTLRRDSGEAQALITLNREILTGLGLMRGVSHTEFIKEREDGRFYFLETSCRVGGAHIADLVECATGINLWAEWAKIEMLQGKEIYHLPPHRNGCGGLLISLAGQERPDTSAYDDPEVVWRLDRKHHAGLVVVSEDDERIAHLLESYKERFARDFQVVMPPPETLR
jgi:biotin carboxylase